MLLPKLDESDNQPKRSVEVENHTFHVLSDDGLFFIALTDRSLSPKVAFAFLSDVKNKFTGSYKPVEWERAIAHSFNAEFSGVLSLLMARFNNMDNDRGLDGTEQNIRKDVMRTNIDSLLNRGERIELLVDTTERLTQASFKFQESATRLKNQHWWKNTKNQIYLAIMLLLIIFLIVITSCGGLDLSQC